jgi:hypothetical protein
VLVGVPVLATVTTLAAWVAGLPASTGLLVAGQAAYLVSATVLLVLEQERRLLVLLSPGVCLASLSVTGVAPLPRWALLLTLVATVLATAAAAARCSPRQGGDRPLLAVLDRELLTGQRCTPARER